MQEHDRERLSAISEELDSLQRREDADVRYDMLSDALYWSDELPSNALKTPERYWCMQPLLRYRMTLILDAPDRELESIWNDSRRLFPNWPGFDPHRARPSEPLQIHFLKLHKKAIDDFNAIPD